jgi:hypothetical protein
MKEILGSGPFSADSTSQLNVLGLDGDTLGMDGTQVSLLEKLHFISLSGFMKCSQSSWLVAKINLEILGNLTDKTLERYLSDEEIGRLLVTTDLPESHSSRPITVGFLYSSMGRSLLASGFGGQLFAQSFSSSGLASGLLGTSHFLGCTKATNK